MSMSVSYDVLLNIKNLGTTKTGIKLTQNDSGIQFRIKIMDGDTVFDDIGADMTIAFLKSDQTVVLGDLTKEGNIYAYTLNGNEISKVGSVVCDVKATYIDGRVSTSKFIFDVDIDTITETSIESTSYLQKFESLLNDSKLIVADLEQRADILESEYAPRLNGVESALPLKTDKTYVDNQFNQIFTISIKDFSTRISEESYNYVVDVVSFQTAIDDIPEGISAKIIIPTSCVFEHTGFVIKKPNIILTGGGTLHGGTVTIGDSTLSYGVNLNIIIDSVNFEYSSTIENDNNAIQFINARKVRVQNCSFNYCDKAIYIPSIVGGFHRNGLISITNNNFNVVNYCWYVDNGATDWQTTNDCMFIQNRANFAMIKGVYIKGIDGVHIVDNTFFFPSYNTTAAEKENKQQNIHIDGIASDWVQIRGNNCFEAGVEGMLLANLKRFVVLDNTIAWNGQRVLSSAIKLIGSQISQGVIANNVLDRFTKNGIEIATAGAPLISSYGNNMYYLSTNPYYYGNTNPYTNGALDSITHYGTYVSGVSNVIGVKIGTSSQNILDYVGADCIAMSFGTRSCFTTCSKSVSVTAANTAILNLFDYKGETANYDGLIKITARSSEYNSSNTASYTLDVGKHGAGSAANLISSHGLTAGGGATHPSFIFSIDITNNKLLVSPVSSTSGTFFFYVTTIHNLKVS